MNIESPSAVASICRPATAVSKELDIAKYLAAQASKEIHDIKREAEQLSSGQRTAGVKIRGLKQGDFWSRYQTAKQKAREALTLVILIKACGRDIDKPSLAEKLRISKHLHLGKHCLRGDERNGILRAYKQLSKIRNRIGGPNWNRKGGYSPSWVATYKGALEWAKARREEQHAS